MEERKAGKRIEKKRRGEGKKRGGRGREREELS